MNAKRLTNWMLAADLLWTTLSFFAGGFLRYGATWGRSDRLSFFALLPFLAASVALWILLFYRFRLDGFQGGWRFPAVAARVLLAILCLMCALLATAYLARRYVSRLVLVYFGVFLFSGFLTLRYGVARSLRARRKRGNLSRIVIVGSGSIAREVACNIGRHPEMLCEVVGFLFPDDGGVDRDGKLEPPGGPTQRITTLGIVDLLRSEDVDELIVAISQPASAEITTLTGRCREAGIRVTLVPQPYELYLCKLVLLDLDGLPLLQLADPSPPLYFRHCKRFVDVAVSSILALLAIPIILPAAAVLRLRKGRAFRWEVRCGYHGERFFMLRLNVERRAATGSRFDQLLEELSITELPQLWNVLRGQMSLVGPRPESPTRAKRYTEWHQRRLSVKPGMTGLAQVQGLRDHNSSEDKTRFDLQYLLYPSVLADLSLLLQTVWTLAKRASRLGQFWAERTSRGSTLATQLKPIQTDKEYSVAHRTQSGPDQLRWRRN